MTDFERHDRTLNMTKAFSENCQDQKGLIFPGKVGILHMKERNLVVQI